MPRDVSPADLTGSIASSLRIQVQENVDETIQSSLLNRQFFTAPDEDGGRIYAVIQPEAVLNVGGVLDAGLGFNSGELSYQAIDGGDLASQAESTFFLQRADVQVYLFREGWASIRGGFWNATSAEGFILDYPLPGIELEGDLDIPMSVPFSFWARLNKVNLEQLSDPGRRSYLVDLGSGYAFSARSEIRASYHYFHDPDNYFRDLMNPILTAHILREVNTGRLRWLGQEFINLLQQGLVEVIEESSSYFHYVRISGATSFRRIRADGILIYQWGEIDLSLISPLPSEVIPVRGYLADGNISYLPGPKYSLRAGCYASSGDGFRNLGLEVTGEDREIVGFFSILPLITKTNLFFNGGISENLFAGSALASGIDGYGVIAPNIVFRADLTRGWGIACTGALLRAQEEKPSRGSWYGEEIDLSLSYYFKRSVMGLIEVDILFPGDFFPAGQEVVYRVAAGLDYRFDF